jgi:translocation and assembly module TamB
VEYQLEGLTLGGKFRLDGTVPVTPQKPQNPVPTGRLRIEGVQLARLWEAWDLSVLRPLRGRLDLTLNFRQDAAGAPPVGTGRVTVGRLRWGEQEWVGPFEGEIRLSGSELRLPDVTGRVAGGLLRGRFVVNLRSPEQSRFTLALDQAEASQLLAPWPALARQLQGPLEARVQGTLGRQWSGSGTVGLIRGKVLGVEVSECRLPFGWTAVPASGRGQIDVREASAQVARGRAQGWGEFGWGYGSRLQGQVQFANLDLQTLVRQSTELAQAGAGQITGHLVLSGNDVRSVNDISASLDARLGQTQAWQFPLLSQLARFAIPGQSTAGYFRSGTLKARLDRGIIRVQDLSLEGPSGLLFIEGKVLLSGAIDLNVIVRTGDNLVTGGALGLVALAVPTVGPIPVSLLVEARNLLANRVLYLRVTGTVRNPVIRVEVLPLLTEEAARFFLNRATLPTR